MQHPISSADRIMWITPDRLLYVGLLGEPSVRCFGSITLYIALPGGAVRVSVDGGAWQQAEVMLVQPYVSHRVSCDTRHIAGIQIEPEFLDLARLPALLRQRSGPVRAACLRKRILRCHAELIRDGQQRATPTAAPAAAPDFDQWLFGAHLPARTPDARIAQVLERIRAEPSGQMLARDCAAQAHLSFSRFLHLFKSETGVAFRRFRAWKRARGLLYYVDGQRTTLTDVALGAGYPDSTHFSHSIRLVYGLKPKDIFAGSRKLRVLGAGQQAGQYF